MNYTYINGGVTAPAGFTANGVCAGVKQATSEAITKATKANESAVIPNGKRDLALIACDKVCNAAAIFTKNLVVIVNSGNANACNPDGYEKAEQMARLAAQALGIDENDVIVASTGVIGQPLPLAPIESGVRELKDILSKDGGTNAAEAIMTTDTVKKEWAVQTVIGGKTVTIGGIAKGSGMIHINMGTTLSFVTTDAAISSDMLHEALLAAADVSYNMVSVDGDTSTNDTLAILASGYAGNAEIRQAACRRRRGRDQAPDLQGRRRCRRTGGKGDRQERHLLLPRQGGDVRRGRQLRQDPLRHRLQRRRRARRAQDRRRLPFRRRRNTGLSKRLRTVV